MNILEKVSIIIPVYNAEQYINITLDNIINQTYTNWELILVDDGSTDKSFEIIKNYSDRDNRIIAVKRDRAPKGSLTCRNIGQEMATGEYFIHFDADDIIASYCLEQRVAFMEQHKEIDYATFKGESIDINGRVIPNGRKWGINPNKDILSCFLSYNYPFSVWNNMYRKEAFIDYYWDEKVKIYTDFSYIVPAIIINKKHAFAEDSRPDYFYRMGHANAMTSSFINEDKYDSTLYLFDKIYEMLAETSSPEKYRRNFRTYFEVQLQRVVLNGSIEQVDSFKNFFSSKYGDITLRMKIILLLFRGSIKRGKKHAYAKRVKFITYLLYEPKTIFIWLKEKMKDH